MKLNFKTLALLALAGMAFNASAATTAYSDGQLLLGFRATGGTGATKELVLNLGSYTTLNASNIAALGSIGTDLSATYGASWNTRADLFWGVIGINNGVSGDVFASAAQSPFGTHPGPYQNVGYFSNQAAVGLVQSVGQSYAGRTSGTNAKVAIETNTDSNPWDLALRDLGGFTSDFIDTSFSGGVATNAIDLFRYLGADAQAGNNAANVGAFTFNSSGQLAFAASAVPEPGRASLLIIGIAGAVLRRRRQA